MLKLKKIKKALTHYLQDRKESYKIPPSGIEKFGFGESVEKRAIYCYRTGSGSKKILFLSAVHGNEIGTIKLAYHILDHLSRNEKKFVTLLGK